MRVTEARFLGAATRPGGEPPPALPEVAIAGRSNVGKSSLLNSLLQRRGLARTSATPGRTRQLNFFVVNERFALVDLPGYGFAVGPERERLGWGPLVEGYLRGRPTLRGVVLIVDVRRGLEAEETQVLDFAAAARAPGSMTPTTGTAQRSRSASSATADAVLHATTSSLMPFSSRNSAFSRL